MKSINAIKKAKNIILNDISQRLLNQDLTGAEIEVLLSQLPVIFAVENVNKDNSHWCFMISEDMRRFDNVLAVSVVPDANKVIDDFFLFSVHDFTKTNFLILHKQDSLYHSAKTENCNVEEIITQLVNSVVKQKDDILFMSTLKV